MKQYLINEIFYSLQGEGEHSGRAAVFIRFSGCNLKCPFCDTDFRNGKWMTGEEIVQAVRDMYIPGAIIVLTGGEPTLQVDEELLKGLAGTKMLICMETNGSRPVPAGVDFITCSPKSDFVGDYEVIPFAHEVKVVFDGVHDPEPWLNRIQSPRYYLQPCDTGDPVVNEQILSKVTEYIKQHPVWRLSLQTQKILKIR